MKYLYSLLVTVGVAVAITTAFAWLCSGWASTVGVDVWNLPSLALAVEEGQRREGELMAEDEAILAYILGKEKAATDVIEGRQTLVEAAALWRDLAGPSPPFPRGG